MVILRFLLSFCVLDLLGEALCGGLGCLLIVCYQGLLLIEITISQAQALEKRQLTPVCREKEQRHLIPRKRHARPVRYDGGIDGAGVQTFEKGGGIIEVSIQSCS